MEKKTQRRLEIAAAGSFVSALGGLAYSRYHGRLTVPNPAILNEERLNEPKRYQLNCIATEILYGHLPAHSNIMAALGINRHHVTHLIGFLTDNGLVVHDKGQRTADIPPHYAPTLALSETIQLPEQYPLMEMARAERVVRRQNANENS